MAKSAAIRPYPELISPSLPMTEAVGFQGFFFDGLTILFAFYPRPVITVTVRPGIHAICRILNENRPMRGSRKTDAGTILLHWWLAGSLIISTLTGLRFAVGMPDTGYLHVLAPVLPVANIWKLHIFAGVSVMALAVAYPVYLRATGLFRRIGLDRARLLALATPGQARWSAINVILYWCLFLALAIQMLTGVLLHRGYGGAAVQIHLLATWFILAYAGLHVAAHWLLGGVPQITRVLRPSRIPAGPAPGVDFPKSSIFTGARILGVSAFAGLSIGGSFFYFDHASRDIVYVSRIDKLAASSLRPDRSDPVWRDAHVVTIHTNQGVNLDGTGESAVEVRAVHDDDNIYFAFTWDDPTRSLKHVPLIKAADGWHGLFSQLPDHRQTSLAQKLSAQGGTNFENAMAEDKFAIMLANDEKPFGPGAFHPGTKPLADKPPSSSGRGLHYTEDGSNVTLWMWHANSADLGLCENNRIGAAASPTNAQSRGLSPYKGGYREERSQSTVADNFTPALPRDWNMTILPVRLPKSLSATRQAMGNVDLDPDHGEAEGARWALNESDSVPYSAELDATLPLGTIIPGLIASPQRPVDVSDVRCEAKWSSGRWTLIAQRRLATGRDSDLQITRHTHLWVAVFDHTPANHTRHIRPFRLELEQ